MKNKSLIESIKHWPSTLLGLVILVATLYLIYTKITTVNEAVLLLGAIGAFAGSFRLIKYKPKSKKDETAP